MFYTYIAAIQLLQIWVPIPFICWAVLLALKQERELLTGCISFCDNLKLVIDKRSQQIINWYGNLAFTNTWLRQNLHSTLYKIVNFFETFGVILLLILQEISDDLWIFKWELEWRERFGVASRTQRHPSRVLEIIKNTNRFLFLLRNLLSVFFPLDDLNDIGMFLPPSHPNIAHVVIRTLSHCLMLRVKKGLLNAKKATLCKRKQMIATKALGSVKKNLMISGKVFMGSDKAS